MSRNPALNRAHQKAFYERLKKDPVLWRAYLDRKAVYKRQVRAGMIRPVVVPTTAELVEAITRRFAGMDALGGGKPCRSASGTQHTPTERGGGE